MSSPLRGDETGLVGYWRLDEDSGQIVYDSTASGNDGTLGNDGAVAANDPTRETSLAPLKGVTDLAGNALDGEYSGGFPSGDGTAGGDFVSTFTIAAPLPKVSAISPAPGATVGAEPASVTVTFTKEMDPATVNEASFRLVSSGLDGTFGDGNEIEIAADSVALTLATRATMDLTTAVLPDDVYQVTVGATPVPTAGLVAYWRLDEGSPSQTATDSSGKGNDGRLGSTSGVDVNDPTWQPAGGRIGGALDFDGTDDFVSVPDSPSLRLAGDMTITFWMNKASEATGWVALVHKGNDTIRNYGLWEEQGAGKRVLFQQYNASGSKIIELYSSGLVETGQWYHVGAVVSGTTVEIYLNGVLDASGTRSGAAAVAPDPVTLGYAIPHDYFDGLIDDVRIYDRALDATQIATLAGNPPPVTDLSGNPLDGEYLGGFPSGDGGAGGDFVTTFTVEEDAPSVIATSPTDDATEVDVTSSIVVTFSERMNQGTTVGAFLISPAVTGVTSCLDNVLTFTPVADLSSDTTYTVTITTDATDLGGGRNLDQECQFTFTTPDTIPPTVDDIRADGALLPGATLGASPSGIVVTFSEAIDPATVTTDTFRLVASGGDGSFIEGNEIEIALASVTPTSATVVTMVLGATELADEEYQVSVGQASTVGLVAYWPFDDGPGSETAADVTGNGYDGTLGSTGGPDANDPTWQPAGGKIDGALLFDGSNDYVDIGTNTDIASNLNAATVTAWIKANAIGGEEQKIVSISRNGDPNLARLFLVLTASGEVFAGGRSTDAEGFQGVKTVATLVPGEWYHLAAVVDYAGDSVTISIDGVPQATTGTVAFSATSTPATTSDAADIGTVGHGTFRFFNGLIDDVRIYDRALTAGEVAVLAGTTVTDLAGNVLDGEYNIATFPPSGDGTAGGDFVIGFTVDKPPRVESITLLGSSPTGAGTVDFAVAFDQDVTGVATSDFAIDGAGVTGTVAAVSGGGTSYTVTVVSVAGDGTLSIDLTDDDSIIDGSGIPLGGTNPGNGDFTAGEAYDIDQTPPSVLSIALADADPTGADTVSFTVTFSEDVTGVLFTEFALATSGTGGDIFSSAPVSPDVYTITVNNVTGNGTLGLNLVDDDDITDLAGNPLGGVGAGNGSYVGDTYTIDNDPPDAPVVTGPASPTADGTPTWDWVQGGSPGDGTFRYQLDGEGGAWTVTAAQTYTPASALPDGLRVLYVQERDAAANWSSSGSFGVTIDTTPPVVTVDSLVTNDVTPALYGTVNDPTATIDVTVDVSSYVATNNGNGTWTLADNIISPPLAEGTYDVQVAATDPLGNWDTDSSIDELVIDLTAPTVTVDSIVTNDVTPALFGTVNDPTATIDVSVDGSSYAATSNADGTWTLADGAITPALAEGTYDVEAIATDLAGNAASDVSTDELVIDLTGPRVTAVVPAPGDTLTAVPGSITVTFDEPIDAATVDASSFRLVASGGDGMFGDGNEVVITPASVALTLPSQATMDLTGAVLPNDVYEVTVAASGGRGALYFDGTDDFVSCPPWLVGSGNNVTVEAWFRPLAGGGPVVMHRAFFNDMDLRWKGLTPNVAVFKIPLDHEATYADASLIPDVWYHAAGTYDGAAVKLYVNGELRASLPYSGSMNWGSGYYGSYIGGDGHDTWGGYFQGEIDEVRVWNICRSQADIQATMRQALTGNEAGLLGYYSFNEGIGQTAVDSSQGGNDGQLGPTNGVDAADPTWVVSTAPLDAGVADVAGNKVDGEYSSTLPSGDGTPGGDFVCTFTIDAPLPPAPVVDGPVTTTDTTPTWTWGPGSATGYFRYGFTEGTWIAEGVTDTEYTPAAPLAVGPHTLYVQERDDMGNWSTSGSFLILIVEPPPPPPPPADPGKTPFGGGCMPETGGGSVFWLAPLVLALLALRRQGSCVRSGRAERNTAIVLGALLLVGCAGLTVPQTPTRESHGVAFAPFASVSAGLLHAPGDPAAPAPGETPTVIMPPVETTPSAPPLLPTGVRLGAFIPAAADVEGYSGSAMLGAYYRGLLRPAPGLVPIPFEIGLDLAWADSDDGRMSSSFCAFRFDCLFSGWPNAPYRADLYFVGGYQIVFAATETAAAVEDTEHVSAFNLGAGVGSPVSRWDTRATYSILAGSDNLGGILSLTMAYCF